MRDINGTKPEMLKMCTLNIRGTSMDIMEIVLQSIQKLHIDVCILTETNLTYYFPRRSQGTSSTQPIHIQ